MIAPRVRSTAVRGLRSPPLLIPPAMRADQDDRDRSWYPAARTASTANTAPNAYAQAVGASSAAPPPLASAVTTKVRAR